MCAHCPFADLDVVTLLSAQKENTLETRELFWSFGSTEIFIFYVFGVLAIAAFLYGVWKHLAKYRMANQSAHTPNLREGLTRVVRDLFSHRTLVRRDRQAGIAHAAVFFGTEHRSQ